MKKIKYILLLLFCLFFSSEVKAIAYTDADIDDYSIVIGSYLFTSDYTQEEYEASGYNGFINTKFAMLAATSIPNYDGTDDMLIYYKYGLDDWVDYISDEAILLPEVVNITHVNGVCIDPICKGQKVNVTLKYNDNVTPNKTESINYKETFSEPAAPTKQGHKFVCWTKVNSDECYDFSTPVEEDLELEASWEVYNYKVTFKDTISGTTKLVECSFTAGNECTYRNYEDLFNLAEGYTFTGWSLAESGEKVYSLNSDFNELFGDNTDFTLLSIFNTSNYSISYNLNGGSFTGLQSPTTIYDPSSLEHNISTPSRVGYQFAGWTVKKGNATINEGKINIDTPSNIEIEANWTANTYNIVYNDVNLNTTACEYDKNCTLDLSLITVPEGKEIKSITATVGGASYPIGTTVKNLTTEAGASIPVTVVIEDIEYNISYELDGGTVSPANPTTTTLNKANVLKVPVKTGYTFARWEVSGGQATVTNTSLTLTEAKDVKLTAQWTANTYNLVYNGKTYGTCTYDVACSLNILESADNPKGKEFANWKYNNEMLGDVVYNLTTENNKTLEIVPDYNYVTYGITYNYDGGIVSTINTSTYNVDTDSITLTSPSKTGYTFTGWSVESDNSLAKINGNNLLISGETGNIRVSALYDPVEFNVIYELDGGTGTVESHKCTYDACTITVAIPTKAGYDFAGWINSGTGYIYESGREVKIDATEDVTLTAKWSNKDMYKIKYHLNGGAFTDESGSDITPNTSYLAGEVPVFTNASKVGYTFNGWLIDGTGNPVMTAPSDVTGDIELYASFSPNSYKVTYMISNYLSSESQPVENLEKIYTYDTKYNLEDLADKFSKKGYTLLGWSITEDGNLYYGNGLDFINLRGGLTNITLYPVVQENKDDYIISYYLDGGSFVDAANVAHSYNKNEYLTLPAVTKNGYKLVKWILEDGTVVDGTETDINRDVVLIPVWEKINDYTVKLVHDYDSAIEPVVINCRFGENCTLPLNTITRDNYSFKGWTLTVRNGAESKTYVDGATLDLTWKMAIAQNSFEFELKAIWEPVKYAVNYTGDGVTMDAGTYTIEDSYIKLPLNTEAGFVSDNTNNLVAWSDSEGNIIKVCADDSNYACASVPETLADMTFTAHYDNETFNVTYSVEDSDVTDTLSLTYGSYLTGLLPDTANTNTQTAANIASWSVDGVTIDLNTYRVTSDITLVGVVE